MRNKSFNIFLFRGIKGIYFLFFIFLFFIKLNYVEATEKVYVDCSERKIIDSFASLDYKESRLVASSANGPVDVPAANDLYINFIGYPDPLTNNLNYLYVPIKAKEVEQIYLTCGFKEDDFLACDMNRISKARNENLCIDTIEENKEVKKIENCSQYNNAVSKESNNKPTCYPPEHICNKYKDNIMNNYYSIEGKNLNKENDKTYREDNFYIYRKNIKESGVGKNCNFKIFSCDAKVKNEYGYRYVNVVDAGSKIHSVENQDFIDNIFGGFGANAFFQYKGICKENNSECVEILKNPSYYKYKLDNNILYFAKKIDYRVCNGYLPNCKYVLLSNSPKVLYNNTTFNDGGNNSKARQSFYTSELTNENDINEVREEHLFFANNSAMREYECLSIEGKDENNVNYDIGYCSDLNDEETDLKYPTGLSKDYLDGKVAYPNCYLKSCLDLTKQELEFIGKKSGGKYCSEYYWLKSSYGFKYFPREKTKKATYCSEIENVDNYGEHLVFREKIDENGDAIPMKEYNLKDVSDASSCKEIIDPASGGTILDCPLIKKYYSGGGGINAERNNCYLKSCFSMETDERKIVVSSKALNLFNELDRIKNIQAKRRSTCEKGARYVTLDGVAVDNAECLASGTCNDCSEVLSKRIDFNLFNEDNLPKYCEDSILKSSRFDENFEDINMNIIRCQDLTNKYNITINSNRMLDSFDLINKFDTKESGVICRNDYPSIVNEDNLVDGKIDKTTGSVLNTLLAKAEENSENKSYLSEERDIGNIFGDSEYFFKVEASSSTFSILSDVRVVAYKNICNFIDNSILYYNAAISGVDMYGGFNNEFDELTNYLNLLGKEKEDFLYKHVYKCENYKTGQGSYANFINDCGLYSNVSEMGKDIISIMDTNIRDKLTTICRAYLTSKEPSANEVEINIVSSRDSVRTDEYNWLLKPVPADEKIVIESDSSIGTTRPAGYDVNADGCVYYENYENEGVNKYISNKYTNGIPLNKSNYIVTTNFSDPLPKKINGEPCIAGEPGCVNGIIKCDESIECSGLEMVCCNATTIVNVDDYDIIAGVRFPMKMDNESNMKCGKREGSQYKDLQIKVKIKDGENKSEILNSDETDRFRIKIVGDKILLFRDALITESNTSGSSPNGVDFKSFNNTFYLEKDIWANGDSYGNGRNAGEGFIKDTKSDGLEDDIYAFKDRAFIHVDNLRYHRIYYPLKSMSYVPFAAEAAGCSLAAGLAAAVGIDFDDVFYPCAGSALFYTTLLTFKDHRDSYLFYLSNTRNHVLDYLTNNNLPSSVKTDSGLIFSGNIVDNNNYLYAYYPRSSNIEQDIRNKFEANVDRSGNRYYHNTVFAKDIIRACRLENLIGDANNEGKLEVVDNPEYRFIYYKLDKDGNRIGECTNYRKDGKNNINNCIDVELQDCLKGYDVSFINHVEKEIKDDIYEDFIMKNGKHLKPFLNCDTIFNTGAILSTSGFVEDCDRKNGETGSYVPLNIVAYTGNKYTDRELKSRNDCKLDDSGNPIGDLSRCRGFSDSSNGYDLFYTESQSVPVPLFTHPFLYYTLITPKNTPELFEATFLLDKYYKFSDYKYNSDGSVSYGVPRDIINPNSVVVDFFNPKFKFAYDYVGGVGDSNLENIFSGPNNFNDYVAEILTNNKKSYAYQVKYKSAKQHENDGEANKNRTNVRVFQYVLDKVYDLTDKSAFVPKVCVYEIRNIDKEANWENGICIKDIPEGKFDHIAAKEDSECFMIADADVACYERNVPFFDNFIFKLDKDSTFYNRPFINVYLKPTNKNYKYVTSEAEKENYIMREADEASLANINEEYGKDAVISRAVNSKQGFGLNFEKSYCSQMYYDYYSYINKLQAEELKEEGKDETLINRLKVKIEAIEKYIIPDCTEENGDEAEFLINQSEIKSFNETGNLKTIVVKKTAIVKKYIEAYGGFNEICVKDADIDNIFTYYNKQTSKNESMPKIVAFKNTDKRNRTTKCLLNEISRNNKNCLVGDSVYVYCKDEEKGVNENCVKSLDIKNHKFSYIKEIKCKELFENGKITRDITDDNIELIEACYKGGFNSLGTVYKRDSGVDGDLEDICACQVAGDKVYEDYFMIREMKPREYGLCVDLVTPDFCPAIKYFGETNEYVDDNLALGITEGRAKELNENEFSQIFDQHLWRTKEKISGILPAVFFTNSLGNAEFDASVYCMADDETKSEEYYKKNCIGGSKYIYGECRGYWRWDSKNSIDKAPKAICTLKTGNGGEKIYEYELVSNSCERYVCPAVAYEDNIFMGDEKELEDNSSVAIISSEIDYYDNIVKTSYQTFTNNEEQDRTTVDKRGSSNGFAAWNKVTSSDYGLNILSENCLTGYGPAGDNYAIRKNMPSSVHDINFDSLTTFREENNMKKFINYVVNQSDQIKNIRINQGIGKNNYPQRICNQKGQWETVDDIYNLKNNLLEKEVFEDSYYYNNKNNYWVKTFNNEFNNSGNNTVSFGGYCERLVCPEIIPENINIYYDEVLRKAAAKYRIWEHNGGAIWASTSAPRNNSNKIDLTSGFTNISKNVNQIFKEYDEDERNFNRFKYLKKAQGECVTDYGYYYRNSQFKGGDFINQLKYLKPSETGSLEVDPRKTYEITNPDEIIKPERTCSSYGLWGGVINRCFRGCEMMDIYHTTFSDDVKNRNNFEIDKNYFIENNDIVSIDTRIELSESEMKNRFEALNLNAPYKHPLKEVNVGDYLTGGASWSRTIINVENAKIDDDVNSPKMGLRYVEVTGLCDQTFENANSNEPRQYVMVEEGKLPVRRCYEDGSWGPVDSNSRCVLAKSCKQFSFSLYDLGKMVDAYNNLKANNDPKIKEKLNILLAGNVVYDKYRENSNPVNCNDNERDTKSCFIYDFSAKNASLDNPTSFNPIIANDGYENNYTDKNMLNFPLICNMTETDKDGYNPGWSLKTEDIGEYFIPKVCDENNTADFSSDIVNLIKSNNNGVIINRNIPVNTQISNNKRYVKESHLNYLYNELTGETDNNFTRASILRDETRKSINIGTKTYNSFQMLYGCNNTYFYNRIRNCEKNNGSSCEYYNQDIVLECKTNGATSGKITHNSNTADASEYDTIVTHKPLHSSQCYVKTCGNSNIDTWLNPYHKNWSLSYIKEATTFGILNIKGAKPDGEAGSVNIIETKSNLKCKGIKNDSGQAACDCTRESNCICTSFVLGDDPSDISNMRSNGFITPFVRDNVDYGSRNYFDTISTYCTINDDQNNINGTKANTLSGKVSYDIQRYGKLDYTKIPKTYCRDLEKKKCVSIPTVNESLIFASGNFNKPISVSNNSFCVPMACNGNNLKINIDGANTTITEAPGDSNTVNLRPSRPYFNFGDYVVIESLPGDFSGRDLDPKGKNPVLVTDRVTLGLGKGGICASNNDVYSVGGLGPFSIFEYPSQTTLSDDYTQYLNKCFFSWMDDYSYISSKSKDDYTQFGKVYVKLNSVYEEEKKIVTFSDAIKNYNPTAEQENEFKRKAAEFIVENLVFKNGGNERGEYTLKESLESDINKKMAQAREEAKKSASEYFKSEGDNYAYCYSEEAKDNDVNMKNNIFTRTLKKVTYDDIFEDDDKKALLNEYVNIVENTRDEFYIDTAEPSFVGMMARATDENCKDTLAKKVEIKNNESTEQRFLKKYCEDGYNYDSENNKCIRIVIGINACYEKEIENNTENNGQDTGDNGQDTGDDGQDTNNNSQDTDNDNQNSGDSDEQNSEISSQNLEDDNQNDNDQNTEESNNNDQDTDNDGQDTGDNGQDTGDNGQNTGDNGQDTEDNKTTKIKIYKCFTVEVFGDEETYTDDDNITWNKDNDNENCEIKEEVEPIETVETSKYKCFYEIDKGNYSNLTSFCDLNEFNKESSSCSSDDDYVVNNQSDIYKDILGNEYITSEEVTDILCDTRDFIADAEWEVTGSSIRNLEDYNSAYRRIYAEKLREIKEELKQTIMSSRSGTDWYSMFEEYYSIYKMEDFLNTEKNFEMYNNDYKGGLDVTDYIDIMIEKSGNRYEIKINNSNESNNTTKEYNVDYLSTTNNKINCNMYYINTETKGSCSEEDENIKNILKTFYTNQFVNFLKIQKDGNESLKNQLQDGEKTVADMVKEFNALEGACSKLYNDYILVEEEYNKKRASGDSIFSSGLFMAIQCTPEGWKVVDQPTCKARCSGSSSTFRMDPKAGFSLQIYFVKLNVSNLRYKIMAQGLTFAHNRDSCYPEQNGTIHTRHAKVFVSCGENGKVETLPLSSNNAQGRFDNESWYEEEYWKLLFLKIWHNRTCHAKTYYDYDVVHNNTRKTCSFIWKVLGYEKSVNYCDKTSFDYNNISSIWFTHSQVLF